MDVERTSSPADAPEDERAALAESERLSTHALSVHSLFVHSLNPMLIADDERRYVDANAAACLFLRLPLEAIRRLRIDDLTAPHLRPGLDAVWSDCLRGGLEGQSIPWELQLPDGTTVAVEASGAPHYRPGRHLGIFVFPVARALNERLDRARSPANAKLTAREREVLTLVAHGNTGIEIADQLLLSPATVQTHVAKALIKLGAKNRAHGITLALQAGELDFEAALDHRPRLVDRKSRDDRATT